MNALSYRQGPLLGVVAATSSANLYYGQPILASIGRSLGTSTADAGAVVVATLTGNALAQLLIVPLTDLLERRRLAQALLCLQAAGMALMVLARGLTMAACASVIMGLGGAAAMVVLPYAAALSDSSRRGRTTGQVMSGVLLGILFSRSLSGFISTATSWRVMYALGGAFALLAALLLAGFPLSHPDGRPDGYRHLLDSLARLARTDHLLQLRMVIGALGFISFNILWTGLTLLLSGSEYRYSDLSIGLFGLIGFVGAVVAKNAGQWHDNGHGEVVSRTGWALTGVAWVIAFAGTHAGIWGIIAVAATIALLDAGMQAQHITNQSVLLSARSQQGGRVTTAYMFTCVLAGAIGSATASWLYPRYGWATLASVGIICSVVALITLALAGRSR